MSVLIKGMEMPTSCERCPMLDWDLDYIKCKVTDRHFKMTECWRAIRVPDCPLVFVPPHGRLIDADALKEKFPNPDNWLDQKDVSCHVTGVWARIDNAPTVITAEEGA